MARRFSLISYFFRCWAQRKRAWVRLNVDPEQFAFELYGVMLVHQHTGRLLADRGVRERTQTAFEALLERARSENPVARASART